MGLEMNPILQFSRNLGDEVLPGISAGSRILRGGRCLSANQGTGDQGTGDQRPGSFLLLGQSYWVTAQGAGDSWIECSSRSQEGPVLARQSCLDERLTLRHIPL
jgi:hypothetical protein